MRTFGLFTVAAMGLCIATANSAAAQEHVFKLHHLFGAKEPAQTQMLEPWARQVEENAAGRVKIEIYPAMTLGGRPQELVQQVRDGVVDIIWTVNGYTPRSEEHTSELQSLMRLSYAVLCLKQKKGL